MRRGEVIECLLDRLAGATGLRDRKQSLVREHRCRQWQAAHHRGREPVEAA